MAPEGGRLLEKGTMKAISFEQPGAAEVLHLVDAPEPEMGPEDVRIRVTATAVNRADLNQRMGFYPPPPGASEILGLECSGEVIEKGASVPDRFSVGDEVMALLPGGGYAEQVTAHYGSVMPVPGGLDLVQAAGLPEVYLTVFLNVFQLAHFPDGGTLLVHGGASGIGTAAMQLAAEAGGTIYVTAGTDEKCARCVELGAAVAINYKTESFADRIAELTSGAGVDVILDPIGGAYLEPNVASLAMGGRLVVIGLMGGGEGKLNMGLLLLKRLQVIGSTLRARPVEEKAAIVAGFQERFGDAIAAGRISPVVDQVLPLAEAAEAHRVLEASTHVGKIILAV